MSKKAPAARPPNDRGNPDRITPWIPPALALLLVIPGFALTYFFDDYDFLGRAQTLHWGDLLPDPQSLFYRPVSRELYFGIINLLGPLGLLGGHVLNAALFGSAVFLLGRLTREIAGPRAALFAGLALAAFGQMPLLAGWISGGQDLLAICFVLAAFNLQAAGRRMLALVAILLAILSKETAIAFVPILLGLDLLLDRRKTVSIGEIAAYALPLILWAAVHPGVRALLPPSPGSATPSYVGSLQPGFLSSLGKTAVTLSNVPLTGAATPWPAPLTFIVFVAATIAAMGTWRAARRGFPRAPNALPPFRRVAILGFAMVALPSLFTSMVVKDWLPYYACVPAVGSSLLAGLVLARWPSIGAGFTVVALLVAGVWCRGMMIDPTVTTERTLTESSVALRRVEAGFKSLWPAFPRNANIYVSTQVSGTRNVYVHMNRYQPLRVWYRDPTILTLTPRRRVARPGPEFLAWISPGLDVHGVDLATFAPLPNGSKPELSEYQNVMRNYARGLADGGQTDRAVQIMLNLPQADSVSWSLDCRLAAAYLFADRRDSEALEILSAVPPIDERVADADMAELLLDRLSTRDLDPFLMRAFGLRGTIANLYRRHMRRFDEQRLVEPARQMARKLQAIEPGDLESANLLGRLGPGRPVDRITTPPVRDSG